MTKLICILLGWKMSANWIKSLQWSGIIGKPKFLETIFGWCAWKQRMCHLRAHCMSDFEVMSCVPRVRRMCTWEGDRHQFLWQISKPIQLTRSPTLSNWYYYPAQKFLFVDMTTSIVWACAHIIYFSNRKPWPLSREFTRNVTYKKIRLCQSARRGPNYLFLARSHAHRRDKNQVLRHSAHLMRAWPLYNARLFHLTANFLPRALNSRRMII